MSWISFMTAESTGEDLHGIQGLFTQGQFYTYTHRMGPKMYVNGLQSYELSIPHIKSLMSECYRRTDAPAGGRPSIIPMLIAQGPGVLRRFQVLGQVSLS